MNLDETARVQRRLGLTPNGVEDAALREATRDFQRRKGLVVTGEIDDRTAMALAGLATDGLLPAWFGTPDEADYVAARLGGSDPDAVRRFQSAAGLPLTGVVDEATARRIGD